MRMRKKILPFITIAIMVFFAACSNEELLPEANAETKIEETRTLSLTASMPGENPTTRIALEQDGKDIVLTWEVGDEIEFAFVQGETKTKSTVTLTAGDITNEGKTAQFNIDIPSQFTSGQFNLYGVYGGGGISIDSPNPQAILPSYAGIAGSLSEVESRKDVMLYFSDTIDVATPQISVEFKHLGSLFSLTFMNATATDISGLTEMRVGDFDVENRWAYNIAEGERYDLVKKEFQNKEDGSGWYISFNPQDITFPAGTPITMWAWYPPLPDKNWPKLKLRAYSPTNYVETSNSKPERTVPTAAGKSYYFYARWNGEELYFTNDQFQRSLTVDVQLPPAN